MNSLKSQTDGNIIMVVPQSRICGIIKLKISRMMDLLNQQLEIAEALESELSQQQLIDIKDEIYGLCEQEVNITKEFLSKFNTSFE